MSKTPLKMGLEMKPQIGYPHTKKLKLVLKGISEGFEDVRCRGCGTLLYRIKGRLQKSQDTVVEVKCRKCGNLNLG